jgi:GDP-L-fucose synthase
LLKVLITGASGFVGKNLAEAFTGRYDLNTPTSAELNLLDHITVRDYLADHKFDIIVHSATTRSNRRVTAPPDLLDRNCRMFFNLVRNEHLFGKMISFGSGAEYDRRNLPPRVTEDYFDTAVPADPYGFSKYICSKYAEQHPKVINLRLFGVFGKYEDYSVRFIANACARAACGLPIVIRQNVVFDYLYTGDLAKIVVRFIENTPSCRTFNVCSGTGHELIELAQHVKNISGKNLEIRCVNSGFGAEYTASNARLRKELPDLEFEPIQASIEALYRWYQQRVDELDRPRLGFDE